MEYYTVEKKNNLGEQYIELSVFQAITNHEVSKIQPVGRFQYRKAFALKVEAQQLADIVFVFNNKYACLLYTSLPL